MIGVNMELELNQVGSFYISDTLMHDPAGLEIIQKIMGECVIVAALHNYGYGRFEYIAFSSHFRAVPRDGSAAPLYAVTSTMGVIHFKEVSHDNA